MKLSTPQIVVLIVSSQALLFADSPAEKLVRKPDAWFRSEAGKRVLGNVLSWQTAHGDWPKNVDTTREPSSGDRKERSGTFDNGATTGELRLLARAFAATKQPNYEVAFTKGFDHILNAQYDNGGWPQFYPLSRRYHRHITFNDGSMIRLMKFLEDVGTEPEFNFIDRQRRDAALKAIDRGLKCIIKCQVKVDGTPTVWCAQHHAETLEPVQARSYEHPSLSGAESAGILLYLMDQQHPSQEIVQAIEAGTAWFKASSIEGFRYRKSKTEPALAKDPSAPRLWARFYEIESNRPIFSDRDGVIKYDIQQIGSERRGGYTWYGNWGDRVAKAYLKWQNRDQQRP